MLRPDVSSGPSAEEEEQVSRFSQLVVGPFRRERVEVEEKYERMEPMMECKEWSFTRGARVGRQAAMMEVFGSMADQMTRLVVLSVRAVSC